MPNTQINVEASSESQTARQDGAERKPSEVSGPLYQIPEATFVVVEYPGYVKDPDRAIETLGGRFQLSRCLPGFQPIDDRARVPLELRFRPQDPFAHPIYGEFIDTCNLVVRIVRRRRKRTNEGWQYHAEVKGVIPETGRFRSIADYQWVPSPNDPVTKVRHAMGTMDLSQLVEFNLDSPNETDLSDLRQFPPPIFSLTELPIPYDYKQNPAVVQVAFQNKDGTKTVRLLNRSKQKQVPALAVAGHEPIPATPTPEIIKFGSNVPKVWVDRVRQLFEDRPVWTKVALCNSVDSSDIQKNMKRILPLVSYYLTSGPWKMCWVRFGYDPRADSKNRMYQALDTRNHFKTGWLRAKRKQFNQVESSHSGTVSHVFDGTEARNTASVYQLCDLLDPRLKELVDTSEYLRATCDPIDGWYYRGVILKLRARMRHLRQAIMNGTEYVPPPEDEMEVVMDGDADNMESNANGVEDEGEQHASVESFAMRGPSAQNSAQGTEKRVMQQVSDMLRSLRSAGAVPEISSAMDINNVEEWDDVFGDDDDENAQTDADATESEFDDEV